MKVTDLYTTAIAEVTRESGAIVGNSLKSIYSRLTSVQPAIDAMADIGINVKSSSGALRDVDDILGDLAGQWSNLSREQQQNLALQIAGKHNLPAYSEMNSKQCVKFRRTLETDNRERNPVTLGDVQRS